MNIKYQHYLQLFQLKIQIHSVCNNDNCNDDYIGEIDRRLKERVKDHNGRDKSSHLAKHSISQDTTAYVMETSAFLTKATTTPLKEK